MRLPVLEGVIRRRLLVNFRVDPAAIQKLLPRPFRPKLHHGHAIAGICLIRLESIRPAGFPHLIGLSSENAAHRIAVEWSNSARAPQEGVFIPRRDTGSRLNVFFGGRVFPGEHHHASFNISDDGLNVDYKMEADDRNVLVRVKGTTSNTLPEESCFRSISEASAFFQNGSLGYSVTRDSSRLDGLILQTHNWSVRAFEVTDVFSSFFGNQKCFPLGSVHFDHALIMRNMRHEWHQAPDLVVPQEEPLDCCHCASRKLPGSPSSAR